MRVEINKQSSDRIGIIAGNHSGYVEALFTCMEAGQVAVPLRDSDDAYRISAATVDRIMTPSAGESWLTRSFCSAATDEIAIVSFTSGTEGLPKGVLLTHRNLGSVVTRLNTLMQVNNSISEYVGVPVYHSFGFGRCRAVAAAGGRCFIPGNGFNPAEIGVMLRNREINAISAVPSLWRVLLANPDAIGAYGRRVRWIEIGSQYMSREEKQALKRLFPEARIVQHYGLTEASRSTLLEIHSTSGAALESVGQAIRDVEVKLNADGRIMIRGDHVACGYLINGETISIQDEDGWFLTKDLGTLENGYLYYKGRGDDVINCGGIKVNPEALETSVFAQLGGNPGVAICRKPDAMRGEGFLVAVLKDAPIDRQQLRETIVQATQALGVNAGNAIALIEVDSLPKTATGKIQRKLLSERYGSVADASDSLTAQAGAIATIFCQALRLRQVRSDDTFISLGGDSLSFVQLAMDLERTLGYLPKGWEHLPIADLEALSPQRRSYTTLETGIFLRALAIFGVVANHAELLPMLPGGAVLLLLLAGSNLARFQSSLLFQGRFMQPIGSLLRNLLIPYWIIAIPYELWKRDFDPSVPLLLANFTNAGSIFPIWFINVLVQIVVAFSLLFSLRSIRTFAASKPWVFGLISVAAGAGALGIFPHVWNTDYLLNRMPYLMFWMFAFGWMVQFAQSKSQKIVTTALIGIAMPILSGVNDSRTGWLMLGALLLLWLPEVSIPQLIKPPIQWAGAAAFYIYLTHMIFIHVVRNVMHIETPWINTIAGLVGGVLVWAGVQAFQQWRTKQKLSSDLIYSDSL